MPDVVVEGAAIDTEAATALSEDRDRLTDAMTRAAAEWGYQAVDVEQIADYAGLTVEDFERQFSGKDQCLLAAFDRFLGRIYEHIDEDCEAARDWPTKVKITIESAFGLVSELEGVARLFLVDAVRSGEAALERRRTSIDSAARRLKQGRLLYPAAEGFPEAMEVTLVAGVVMMASSRLLAEEADLLPGLVPEAVEIVLTPYLGSRAARQAAAG